VARTDFSQLVHAELQSQTKQAEADLLNGSLLEGGAAG